MRLRPVTPPGEQSFAAPAEDPPVEGIKMEARLQEHRAGDRVASI